MASIRSAQCKWSRSLAEFYVSVEDAACAEFTASAAYTAGASPVVDITVSFTGGTSGLVRRRRGPISGAPAEFPAGTVAYVNSVDVAIEEEGDLASWDTFDPPEKCA